MALLKECSVSPILMPHGSIDTTIGSMNQSISCSAPITSSPYIVDSLGISRTKWLNRKNSATFCQLLPKNRTIEMSKSMTSSFSPFFNKPVLKILRNSDIFTNLSVSHPLGDICGVRGKTTRGSVDSFSTKSPVGGEGHQEWWHLPDNMKESLDLRENYLKKLEVLQQKFGIRSRELLLRVLVHESYYNFFMPFEIRDAVVERSKSVLGSRLSTENLGENAEKGYEEGIISKDLQIREGQQPLVTKADAVRGFTAHRMIRSQLELLGDSVITLTTLDHLIRRHRLALAGILTEWRSALVSNKNIGRVGIRNFGLMETILTEPQLCRQSLEDPSPTFSKDAQVSVVADGVEMLVGAVYVEQGMIGAMTFVSTHLLPLLEHAIESGDKPEDFETFVVDEDLVETGELHEIGEEVVEKTIPFQGRHPISALHELCQRFRCRPVYKEAGIVQGRSRPLFQIEVYWNERLLSTGVGTTKAEAKLDASTKALQFFRAKGRQL